MSIKSDIYNHYSKAAASADARYILSMIGQIFNQSYIELPHPEYPDINTQCKASYQETNFNILFFSDEAGGYQWFLVQAGAFMNLLVTEQSEYRVAAGMDGPITKALSLIRSGALQKKWSENNQFGGFRLSHSRPYHFFYDQLINVKRIASLLPTHLRRIYIDEQSFWNPDSTFGVEHRKAEPGYYYFNPSLIYSFKWKREAPHDYFSAAADLEMRINQQSEASRSREAQAEPDYDLVLWIGITGQKRAWLEQEIGYAEIINCLRKDYNSILVYIDGLTAPIGKTLSAEEDRDIGLSIANQIDNSDDSIRFKYIMGMDYRDKINICKSIDVFIANAGSGCIVPLRLGRKPGVLHSNKSLNTFGGDVYPNTVRFIHNKFVTEALGDSNKPKGEISYHIDWRDLYAELFDVLSDRGDQRS